jgi:hypothetical protein
MPAAGCWLLARLLLAAWATYELLIAVRLSGNLGARLQALRGPRSLRTYYIPNTTLYIALLAGCLPACLPACCALLLLGAGCWMLGAGLLGCLWDVGGWRCCARHGGSGLVVAVRRDTLTAICSRSQQPAASSQQQPGSSQQRKA